MFDVKVLTLVLTCQGTYTHQQRAQQDADDAAREFDRRGKQALNEAIKAKEETSKFLQQTMQQ